MFKLLLEQSGASVYGGSQSQTLFVLHLPCPLQWFGHIPYEYFINTIKKINSEVDIYFINLYYCDTNDEYKNIKMENYININFYDYIDYNKQYNEDMFYRIIEYDWKPIYYIIRKELNEEDKKNFQFYN